MLQNISPFCLSLSKYSVKFNVSTSSAEIGAIFMANFIRD